MPTLHSWHRLLYMPGSVKRQTQAWAHFTLLRWELEHLSMFCEIMAEKGAVKCTCRLLDRDRDRRMRTLSNLSLLGVPSLLLNFVSTLAQTLRGTDEPGFFRGSGAPRLPAFVQRIALGVPHQLVFGCLPEASVKEHGQKANGRRRCVICFHPRSRILSCSSCKADSRQMALAAWPHTLTCNSPAGTLKEDLAEEVLVNWSSW